MNEAALILAMFKRNLELLGFTTFKFFSEKVEF